MPDIYSIPVFVLAILLSVGLHVFVLWPEPHFVRSSNKVLFKTRSECKHISGKKVFLLVLC